MARTTQLTVGLVLVLTLGAATATPATAIRDGVDEPDTQKRWAGGELLVCAIIQLILVNVAYRIDRSKGAPLLSTSSWAIIFGLLCGGLLSLVSEKVRHLTSEDVQRKGPIGSPACCVLTVLLQRASSVGLDPQILFFGLLPPIILEAGFNTQRKGFFSNFWAILLLAIVGTLIATFATSGIIIFLGQRGLITKFSSAEAFLYGSLISAIDPVATLLVFKKCKAPSLLFNLVFGESVLNDAVAIVIFSLFKDFVESGNTDVTMQTALSMVAQLLGIGLGSVALAAVICYSSAYFLRHSDPRLKQHPTYEISIVLLSSYASYVAADLCELSGLLAVFFSGVFIRHYHMYNISKASAFAFKHLLSTIAFLAENFIYLYLGISVIAYQSSFKWDWGFVLANFVACLLARALNTFPLCSIANACRSVRRRIPFSYMLVIWFSGLRGAIAFALALNVRTSNPDHAAIIKSSTLFTVLFTTVFFGMGTSPLLSVLGLSKKSTDEETIVVVQPRSNGADEEMTQSSRLELDIPDDTVEASNGEKRTLLPVHHHEHESVHDAWVEIDERFLKPLFGGKPRPRSDSTASASWQGYIDLEK
ncbi:TPA: hypothetical protein N0F65_009874 [Lagenidium giganteum]|uniref:Sodium/hydrogen exchanger n=1 Tax=Lagenidium giganteum TaxID=4803 RepID=A0AAV2YVJ4_9STRA|nr:TPA: hypothetical protein N0F65_009874 [Lagenidium giganteum]